MERFLNPLIGLAYPSSKGAVENVWKKGGKAWKVFGQTFCLSRPSGPVRFVTAFISRASRPAASCFALQRLTEISPKPE